MKKLIPYLFVIFITGFMLIFPENAIIWAKNGLSLCSEIIIPSLFPFFVCSGLLTYSGVCRVLSKIAGPIMKPLFNVNGSGALALVLGIISGYPLGAVTACNLYESGYLSKSETERLLAFCNNSGPLFILGAVGVSIYASPEIGIMLYLSHILASLTVGIIFRFYDKNRHTSPIYTVTQPELSFSDVFSKVLAQSINSILTVCGAIIFFSVVSGMTASLLSENSTLSPFIISLLELTGGTKYISTSQMPLILKLIMSSFCVGFAGISVHLQVMSIVKKQNLSCTPYILGKILHGIISATYTFLYLRFFTKAQLVFTNTQKAMGAGYCMASVYSFISIFFIIILAALVVFFLYLLAKRRQIVKRI